MEPKDLFHLLVDCVNDYPIFTLDVDGIVCTWNAGAERLKGYRASEIIGRHFSIFFLPEDIASGLPEQELEIAIQEGVCEKEGWRVRKDGTRFWATLAILPLFDKDGALRGFAKVTCDMTARSQLAQQVNNLFEVSRDMHLVMGFDGHYVRVSPKFGRILGYTAEDLLAIPWLDLVHQDDLAAGVQAANDLSSGHDWHSFINRYRCFDGTYRWLHWSAVCHPGSNLIVAVVRDITEIKRSEATVRDQAESLTKYGDALELAQEVAKIGHWDFDPRKGNVVWSKALFKIMGRDPSLGEPSAVENLAQFCVQDAARLAKALQGVLSEGLPYDLDLRLACPEGELCRWIHANAKAMTSESGRVERVIGTMMDVTDRKRTEETLRETDERLRLATGSGEMGVWDYDVITKKLQWDERMASLYECTLEEFAGTYDAWFGRVHPEDQQRVGEHLKAAIQGIRKYDCVFRVALKSGAIRYIRADAVVLKDEHGLPVRMIGLNYDVSASRETEEKLRLIAIEQETTNFRLRQSEEVLRSRSQELVRSNTDLEHFANVASHDLQEPLRMVISFLQLLEKKYKGQLDEQADRWIDHAVGGALRMQTLIRDLLTYSRVGRQGAEFRTGEASDFVGIALKNLQLAISESGAEVTFGWLPCVRGDESQLVSVFQNLIGNAIKYCDKQPPRIHISAEQREKDCVFSIRDNGIGIAPQFSERIFVIFQRLHSRNSYPGTGIGLALCKRIVEGHGGQIWIESIPGEGSTFFFSLPSKSSEAHYEQPRSA